MMEDDIRYSDKDILESRLRELGRFRAALEKEKGIEICFKFIPSERIKDNDPVNIDVDGSIRNMNAGAMSDIDFECLEHLKARYSRAIEEFDFRQRLGYGVYFDPNKIGRNGI